MNLQIQQFMAANIIDIKKYDPKSSDIYFFDNNIWMYIFCPLGSYNQIKQKHYSNLLQNIQSLKCCIFINSLILSEFSNRYLRMDFELWKKETKNYSADYKLNYVSSERYKETVKEIKNSIHKIMNICEKSNDNFNAIDLNKVLNHFTFIDFNDSYYVEIANMFKWKFVTDDSDFIKYDNHFLDVITVLN